MRPWCLDYAATQDCHAAYTGHDNPPLHSIQTHGRPVTMLSIDVMSHWNIQLPILISLVRPDWKILPRPSTHTREHSTIYSGSQSEAR